MGKIANNFLKGDGNNDGEPDTHRKLEFEKKAKNWLELKILDGLGWNLKIFNLTHQKRSEAKVDLRGNFKNISKWLQITYLWMVWDDIWEYSIWPTKRGQRPKLTSEAKVDLRGQSWPERSLQKNVKMTTNFILVDGLGLDLRIFNLTRQKR